MIDRNENEINLSQFQEKDLIVIINSNSVVEADERAPLYAQLEEKYEKKVQILSLPACRFFYDGHQDDESKRLINFLKNKAQCHAQQADEDGLTFVVDNKAHKSGHEIISCIGRNLTSNQLNDEITKHLN